MGNVTVPTPIALAGAGLCLLGGYLVGVVAGPAGQSQSTAEVESYDADSDRLCLAGSAVAEDPASREGVLCGIWRRDDGTRTPAKGDEFRFVTMTSSSDGEMAIYIFGDVVR